MPARVNLSLLAFVDSDLESLIGKLVLEPKRPGFATQFRQQVRAWEAQISILRTMARELLAGHAAATESRLLLEFEIPRRQKRPDVILLINGLVLVLEFKIGASTFDRAARWQVEDYALDLHDFHGGSRGRPIVPALVASAATGSRLAALELVGGVAPVQCLRPADLATFVRDLVRRATDAGCEQIDPDGWLSAPYRPAFSIIEAAERLYASHSVREISHAYADNLGETCDDLVRAIRTAQRRGRRIVCFVTGVPGSGKTLAGLSAVHDPKLRQEGRPTGVFLSGNVPLVRVIREALARDRASRGGTRRDARREVSTFVQNVHSFIAEYGLDHPDQAPHENVVVFDEAQRAWDARQVEKKRGIDRSEAEIVLDVMSRCSGWAVIVALVGEGQEIYRGEAGIEEWFRAIRKQSHAWDVWTPNWTTQSEQVRDRALEARPSGEVEVCPSMHLAVSVRSPRAEFIATWVDHVLSLHAEEASSCARRIRGFPIRITRDLDVAREWLRDHSRGDRRCGLVASSRALRHRAYGLEMSSSFRRGYAFNEWFLGAATDVRSSYQLEVAASQFEIQGLELDWVGLCWGGDLCIDPTTKGWLRRDFVGNRWTIVRGEEAQLNLENTYRVLLTRAREGLVIWVPRGSETEPTLDPRPLDATADYLASAGVELVE